MGSSIVRFAAGVAVAFPLWAGAAAPNLVTNGDFESGNAGFTSDYSYSPGSNGTESQYTVRADPYPWNGSFVSMADHTTGSGKMFVGNGSPTSGAVVWRSGPISVTANTDYFFEAYVSNVCCRASYSGANSPAVLEFSIATPDVVSLGTSVTSLALTGQWQGLGKTWNSGSTTSVTLSLVNRNTAVGGNDFVVDDIYFGTESSLPPVPEPQTYALMALGLLALTLKARRPSRVR
jgi:hypothetical protein